MGIPKKAISKQHFEPKARGMTPGAAAPQDEELEENPMNVNAIEEWTARQTEHEYRDMMYYILTNIWNLGPQEKDVKCIMRFFDDPETKLHETQDVATFNMGEQEVC